MRVMPIRMPSSTAITPETSHWIPVSSSTSFTATSAGEYPTSAQPVGYSHTPESARCTRRIRPRSSCTTAPMADFGVT